MMKMLIFFIYKHASSFSDNAHGDDNDNNSSGSGSGSGIGRKSGGSGGSGTSSGGSGGNNDGFWIIGCRANTSVLLIQLAQLARTMIY